MTDLMAILTKACGTPSQNDRAALLLSSGLDSISVGMAVQAAGMSVQAYTIELDGYPAAELRGAELISHYMGWPLKVISVPVAHIADDFIRLAVAHSCKRKVQFECSFPLMYALAAIEEADVFTGFNADDHYGNSREAVFERDRQRKAGLSASQRQAWFDAHRKAVLARVRNLDSGDTWGFAQRLASACGKRLHDPYLDEEVEAYFAALSHDELVRPSKPLVRRSMGNQILKLQGVIGSGLMLQKSMGVSGLFKTLLAAPRINRFEKPYTTVASLCQRWGKEVAANPLPFKAELADLPSSTPVRIRTSHLKSYSRTSMDDVRAASERRRFTAVSMFAGGGGSSLGYRLAGGEVLFASEFVPEAAATYRANSPNTVVATHDIRKFLIDPELMRSLLDRASLRPGTLDILDGSPPCSEYSIGGKGISDQSVPKSYSDTTQRGIAALPFDYMDFAHILKPKVLVMENVPALAGRGLAVLERIKDALRFCNGSRSYFAAHAILNAADFGAPQKRRRLFVLGIRGDVAAHLGIREDRDVVRFFPHPSHVHLTVRDALADLHQTDKDIWPWKSTPMTSDFGRVIRLLPKSPPRHIRLSDIDPGIRDNFTLTRCSWDHPAPTFTVVGQSPGDLAGAIHPDQDRKFTIPELKRLTGLPDDFTLTGTLAQAAERICRMVPPPLTQAIAESIYERVLQPYREAIHEKC